ncbi:hypothetical protein CMUS01_05581 [Colletotrichum musicola]|uniref:Uncharacterized protein n=1 Tax=Colletotrichum musicola TaxID=2175873 RepID=A0A8H6KRL7_9PEZI|nr:hypothetical protein CMUS01_05581 [Colletotrichum musicola]
MESEAAQPLPKFGQGFGDVGWPPGVSLPFSRGQDRGVAVFQALGKDGWLPCRPFSGRAVDLCGSREVSFALRVGVELAARLCSGIAESRGKKGASNGWWTNPATRPGGQPEEATWLSYREGSRCNSCEARPISDAANSPRSEEKNARQPSQSPNPETIGVRHTERASAGAAWCGAVQVGSTVGGSLARLKSSSLFPSSRPASFLPSSRPTAIERRASEVYQEASLRVIIRAPSLGDCGSCNGDIIFPRHQQSTVAPLAAGCGTNRWPEIRSGPSRHGSMDERCPGGEIPVPPRMNLVARSALTERERVVAKRQGTD